MSNKMGRLCNFCVPIRSRLFEQIINAGAFGFLARQAFVPKEGPTSTLFSGSWLFVETSTVTKLCFGSGVREHNYVTSVCRPDKSSVLLMWFHT